MYVAKEKREHNHIIGMGQPSIPKHFAIGTSQMYLYIGFTFSFARQSSHSIQYGRKTKTTTIESRTAYGTEARELQRENRK